MILLYLYGYVSFKEIEAWICETKSKQSSNLLQKNKLLYLEKLFSKRISEK